MKGIRVYIAGPITNGDQLRNIGVAIEAFNSLLSMGYVPFCPHAMTYTAHMVCPRAHGEWMEFDYQWLEQCHCVLRLPGESTGADLEVVHAGSNGIPVFHTIGDMDVWFRQTMGVTNATI